MLGTLLSYRNESCSHLAEYLGILKIRPLHCFCISNVSSIAIKLTLSYGLS